MNMSKSSKFVSAFQPTISSRKRHQVNDRMDILSPALEERILELSRKPNVYEILAASLGTTIR
jgi:DNA replicative helicase MCM subunit Mcm2 (Cdc46/Mcm family)